MAAHTDGGDGGDSVEHLEKVGFVDGRGEVADVQGGVTVDLGAIDVCGRGGVVCGGGGGHSLLDHFLLRMQNVGAMLRMRRLGGRQTPIPAAT